MSKKPQDPFDPDAASEGAAGQEAPDPAEIDADVDLEVEAERGAGADDGVAGDESGDPRERRIAELESQIAELKDHSLRVLADSENLRRRTDREKEQWRRYAAADLAKDLLDAIDNLGRAIAAAPAERDSLDDSVKNVIIGVEMTQKALLEAFEKNHIRRIDPLGEKFDYNLHQAMFEVEGSGKPAGTVVEVMAPGYVLHDRLLRAAMVGVAKGGSPEAHQSVDTTA